MIRFNDEEEYLYNYLKTKITPLKKRIIEIKDIFERGSDKYKDKNRAILLTDSEGVDLSTELIFIRMVLTERQKNFNRFFRLYGDSSYNL